VVVFHYTIRDTDDNILETTNASDPLAILQGHGNVLRGIETALDGHSAGDTLTVTLAPADAYGERRDDWIQRVSKKYLPKSPRLKPGMAVKLNTEQGQRSVTVLKVGNKVVDVDLNHPFAGSTLTFDLELLEVREAAPEELSHGHVHGPGGHHH
jgi:FKBP-type peptidyl-prolyl cis-trans isomerase SlyD